MTTRDMTSRAKTFSFACAALFAAGAQAANTPEADHQVAWLSSVTEGCYNDPANWTDGVVPTNGMFGKYGVINFTGADRTIKAPPGGLVEDSGTIFLGCGSTTHTLTIDTRGSFWEKANVCATNNWWGTPFAYNTTGTHIFNFEGLGNGTPTARIWRFDDALFTWTSTGLTKQDFDLWSGTMTYGSQLMVGSNGGTLNFNIHPEATLQGSGQFAQRGNAETHTTFLGGRHPLNGIVLKDQSSNVPATYMHLTNDAVVVSRNFISIAVKSSGTYPYSGNSKAYLDLSCTARMEVTNGVYVGSGNTSAPAIANYGSIELRDASSFYSHNNVVLGQAQCSTGDLVVVDHAVFEGGVANGAAFYLGYASNAVGRLDVAGDGVVTCGGVLYLGNARDTSGLVTLRDRAKLSVSPSIGNWMCLGPNGVNSYGYFEAGDDSETTLSDRSSVEMTMGGTARAEFVLKGRARFLGGSASVITNKSEIAGNTSVSISDDAYLLIRAIRGGSPTDGSAKMSFAADGGTIAPSGPATPPVPFMCGCVATLGAGGLTLDSKGGAIVLDQDFAAAGDAPAATFTKKGAGTFTVRRNSTHPRTVIEGGNLAFANGATRFGEELVLSNGVRLVMSSGATLAAGRLVFDGTLQIEVPNDFALDEAHDLVTLDEALTDDQLARIVVGNPEMGKDYALAKGGVDGRTLSVTVSAATPGARTWNGGNGSWNVAANWDPEGTPTHNDAVTVASGAAITMDAAGAAGTIAVTTTDAVTISGDAALSPAAGVDVVQGGNLAVSAPISAGGTLEKSGKGTLTASGDNAGMTGDWNLTGGVTEFASAAALGADSSSPGALTISNCTFRYTGEATTVQRPIRVTGEYCSVLDVVGDLTFEKTQVSYGGSVGGGLVKTGAGTLTLDVPNGTTTLSTRGGNGARGGNQDTSGTASFANGEVSSWNGVAQFSVLDGRVVVQGKGKTASTVYQQHHGSIGGGGWTSTVAPELYLKDVTYWSGSGQGYHLLMDVAVKQGVPASKLILDNANLEVNGLNIGQSKATTYSDVVRPLLAITNGTLNVAWNFSAPNASDMSPCIRIGRGGVLKRSGSTTAGGITFNHALDTRVEDGGLVQVDSPQNLYLGASSRGEIVFANGGGMKVHRFLGGNTGAADLTFDGGTAEFTLDNGVSTTMSPALSSFRAAAGGGELKVASGKTHVLAVPLRGEGRFRKTGAGTLVLTNDLGYAMSNNLPVYSPLASSTVKVACGGGLRIDEGAVKCVAGTTDASSRFSGTGTLSGSFTEFTLDVEPGATDALTFADLAATKVTVDFGCTGGATTQTGDVAAVAKLPSRAAFDAIAWKGVNSGARMTQTFSYDDGTGVVSATFRVNGFMVIFR